jgi:acyl-CoA synthetase (AMP-forming)/AMP-acid ligase II
MILCSAGQSRRYRKDGFWGDRTLLDAFSRHVHREPERTALVDPLNKPELTGLPAERVSFGELDRAADAVACALADLGIGKDDVVLVQLPNIWELALLYLAVARAGAVISPLPLQWRRKEFTYIAALTGAKAFISLDEFKGFRPLDLARENLAGLPRLKHVLSLSWLREAIQRPVNSELLPAPAVTADDIFTICWTSGTEAEPKGCPLSHNNWTFQGGVVERSTGFRPGDVQLCVAPLVNMTALGVQFVPWLLFGGTFVLHHPLDVEMCLWQLGTEKVNFTIMPPAVLNMILKHPRIGAYDLSAVRTITSGSAPLSPWALQEFQRRWDIAVVNIWGQNEGTGLVSGPADIPDPARRAEVFPDWGRPGWSVKGVQTKIVDTQTGRLLTEPGAVGELAYRGPNVMPAYFGRPDLTAKAFDQDGYFYTGDLFLIKEGNLLSFFDRKKDIIIRGGFNISAQEVENSLLGHPAVMDVAAVGMPDEIMGKKTCVFVVLRPGLTVDLAELGAFMRDQGLAVYKLPERLEVIDQIPRNPVGKILKSQLREELRRRLQTDRQRPL